MVHAACMPFILMPDALKRERRHSPENRARWWLVAVCSVFSQSPDISRCPLNEYSLNAHSIIHANLRRAHYRDTSRWTGHSERRDTYIPVHARAVLCRWQRVERMHVLTANPRSVLSKFSRHWHRIQRRAKPLAVERFVPHPTALEQLSTRGILRE